MRDWLAQLFHATYSNKVYRFFCGAEELYWENVEGKLRIGQKEIKLHQPYCHDTTCMYCMYS